MQEAADNIGLAVAAAADWPLPDNSLVVYFSRVCSAIVHSLRILFAQERAYYHRAQEERRLGKPFSTEVRLRFRQQLHPGKTNLSTPKSMTRTHTCLVDS